MNRKKDTGSTSNFCQLIKYAEDFSKVYRAEKKNKKQLKASQKQLLKYAEALNNTITELKERNIELQESYLDAIHRLVLAAEYKDEETGNHIVRMSKYSALLAEKLGLPVKAVQNIKYATPMHDLGKIGIPDNILTKPGKLTDEEFETMTKHTTIGAKILADSRSEILKTARRIALTHHEKWDGTGYPNSLSKNKIPVEGRIVGLADVFDALTSKRPYKEPYPIEAAIEIIKLGRGHHFDPVIVDIFLDNIKEIKKIKKEVDSLEGFPTFPFIWSERDRRDGIDKKIPLADIIRFSNKNELPSQ